NGSFDGLALDGLNAVIVFNNVRQKRYLYPTAGYIDKRASDGQAKALQAIFTGTSGGPMAQLVQYVGDKFVIKRVEIDYKLEGANRSAEIPGALKMSIDPLPTLHQS